VNIAYVEDGVPVRGVVYAPAKGGCSTPRRRPERRGNGPLRPETVGETFADRGLHARQRRADRRGLEIHRDAATDDYIAKYAVAD
jgi:3'(2'), 5'-bisphosphate nucleotidase